MINRMMNIRYSTPATRNPALRHLQTTAAAARMGRADTRAAAEKAIFRAIPPEPEDARLTGATRSLYRRLLALNLPGKIAPSGFSAPSKVA